MELVVDKIRPESRKKFERLGLSFMRQSLQMGITNPTENVEAQRWIVEEGHRVERRELWRYWMMLVLTIIAAVAAVIAAAPVVRDWIR